MKIVLTVHQFLPDHASGTEILTYETAKQLQKLGHTVGIFTALVTLKELTDAERFDQYSYDGIPVERFFNYKAVGRQFNAVEIEYNNHLVGAYFKDYLKREKPDIVHFFHLAHLSASPIDACQELGIPMALTPTDFWFACPLFELRLPNNQVCAGPDSLGGNCLHHKMPKSRYRRVNLLIQRLPDKLFGFVIEFVKKMGNIDGKYSPMIRALSERQEFLQKRINLIDKVIIPTRIMHSVLRQNGLEASRIISIPFGINLAHLQNAKRPKPANVLRLGYIGTLNEHKGIHVLFQAIAQLAGRPIELNVYGRMNDGSGYLKEIKILAQNDPRIKFCGTFPNAEIGTIFSEMDALVVPSLWHENSPLVIYSAQYAKCPVIASNMAGISEVIIHEKNGLLFPAGNVSALAGEIERLLDNREFLQRLSDNAIRPQSIHDYVSKLEGVYDNLMKEKESI